MDKSAKHDEFAESCRPLKELLDSVRTIEGFPIGKDEDIIALSDPPYYIACPNPYINDFVKKYGKPYDQETDKYECTPFVSNVAEGKNDPIYNAHSYHTKVPHKAIMRFVEHYTKPGDIIFDGFSGTGMTGAAAQVSERFAVLGDLAPIASFVSYNLNCPVNISDFLNQAEVIMHDVEDKYGWVYETVQKGSKIRGRINYSVWSDVYICPYCKNEYVLWDACVIKGEEYKRYKCSHCSAELEKSDCEHALVTVFDGAINKSIPQVKQVPVLISYTFSGKRYEKAPDKEDFDLIHKIENEAIPYWFPANRMPEGDEARRNDKFGITHTHHFYTKRNLWALSAIHDRISKIQNTRLRNYMLFFFTSLYSRSQKMNRYMPNHDRHVGPLSGTLYISSFPVEINVFEIAKDKKNSLKLLGGQKKTTIVTTQSLTKHNPFIEDSSFDYIFTDPPFGENLMYSELNYILESWLKVIENNREEAIINDTQGKDLRTYKELMVDSFKECYRILKPNRWITVVFHNSRAAVWNAIQDALAKAGFVIAQVVVMDKKKGTTKQLTYAGAVKNDLVISAYKPKRQFEESFLRKAGEGLERDFIEEHLQHLPIEPNIERTEQMLYSKMLAHYVQHGFEIRLNAKQCYARLRDNFKLIDGYWFNDNQVLKYEEWKKKYGLAGIEQIKSGQQVLFVFDERSALIWLYYFVDSSKTYSDIYTAYTKAISSVEDQIPELKELLSNNFIFEGKSYRRPKTEREQENIGEQREKDLSKAFEKVLAEARTSRKKIKEVRKEAVLHGFTKAYQEKHFEDIIAVAKKLDRKILEENSEINDFVEIAQLKLGVEL